MAAARVRGRRIGVFGGTFNPIHFGHLRTAEEIAEELDLDRMLFVPSASPPHKDRQNLVSAHHRLHMVQLAVANHPRFRASDMELRRGGRSYSVDTLRALQRRTGRNAHLFFVLGLDAFLELDTWKDYEAIFSLASIVVTSRPPRELPRPSRAQLPVAVRRDFCYVSGQRGFVHRSGRQIVFRRVTALDISASDIRDRLSQGRSIRYLVPASVARYISRHHLYRARAPER